MRSSLRVPALPVPTGRLALAAAVGAVAVLAVPMGAPVGLVAVDLTLLLAALTDWWAAPRPGLVGVVRDLPGVLISASTGQLTWIVTNPTARRLRVRLADELAPSLRAGTRRPELRLPGRGTGRTSTALRPARRGRFTPTEIVVRTYGPLGLMARQGRRQLPGEVRVYPRFPSRAATELRIDRARIHEVGLRSAQGRGSGTEFDALREYTVDDESRRIDWAATARTGRPIVRTYRAERNQAVLLLVDNGRLMAGRVGDAPRVEHAMDAALAVATAATRLGDRVGLIVFDRRVRAALPARRGTSQITRLNEAMYRLEPELVGSDYRAGFLEAAVLGRRRALLVVLTELAEGALEDSLVPALPLLTGRHVVVVGAVSDPELHRWAAAAPSNPSDVYRKAAAVGAAAGRRRLGRRLQGAGATVVDAPPGQLASTLVDTYLAVKATGRL